MNASTEPVKVGWIICPHCHAAFTRLAFDRHRVYNSDVQPGGDKFCLSEFAMETMREEMGFVRLDLSEGTVWMVSCLNREEAVPFRRRLQARIQGAWDTFRRRLQAFFKWLFFQ